MGKLILTAGLCLVIASLASAHYDHYKLVCYYDHNARTRPSYGAFTVSNINPNLCTHLIFTTANINSIHSLDLYNDDDDDHYYSCNHLKHRNPVLKTLLEVGGLNFDTQKFSLVVSTAAYRGVFVQSAIYILRYYGFDGLNIDWRYPGTNDRLGFTLLCKELKEAFEAEGTATNRDRLLITASVSAVKATIDASYQVSEIAKHLDFLNVLAFDFDEATSETATIHHSPLYQGSHDSGNNIYLNADYAMRYWRDQGVSSDQLILGVATYGKTFQLVDSASHGVGALVTGPGQAGSYSIRSGFLAYYEVCSFLTSATVHVIADQKVPYATNGNQWVGYDNKYSLVHKVDYIRTNHFGGAFVASMDLDDFKGYFCKEGCFSFITHLHGLLNPDAPNVCYGRDDGLYENPKDRKSYYNCLSGRGYIESCHYNMVFRQNCQCCEDPTPTTPHNICEGKLYGLIPHPSDSHYFYSCAHGIAYLFQCPSNLVFKTSSNCCDYPTISYDKNPCDGKPDGNIPCEGHTYYYYQCINGVAYLQHCPDYSVYGTSCGYTTSSTNFCYDKPDGYYFNPNDARSFYHCENHVTELDYCDSYLVFDQSCNCCAHPTTTSYGTPCHEYVNGLFPFPYDEHYFYHCCNGITYIKRCPADLVFKTYCSCCDFHTHISTSPCDGLTQGYLAYAADPSCFYNCHGGINHLLECPDHHLYDHSSQGCVYSLISSTGNPCYGNHGGLFPHPDDPHYFYHCSHGIAYIKVCPSSLVFDTHCTCCNYPPPTDNSPCCGRASGLYANNADPYTFYSCANGIAYLQSCAPGTIFDSSIRNCNHPPATYTAPCGGKTYGLAVNTYSHNCYYTCSEGIHNHECPDGMVFKDYCHCCEYPTVILPTNPCHGKAHWLVACSYDKHSYYSCDDDGVAVLHHCPSYMVFQSSSQCCDYPIIPYTGNPCYGKPNGNIPCSGYPYYYYTCINGGAHLHHCPDYSIYGTSCSYPSITNFCYGRADGVYVNPNDPHSFYHCSHGRDYIKNCPDYLVFSPTCRCCDYYKPIHIAGYCYGKLDGLYADPQHNHYFYHCSNGLTYYKHCAAKLVFNPTTKQCDYSTSISTGTFCAGKADGLYADTANTHYFYHCSNGITYYKPCAADLVFDPSSNCCVYSLTTHTNPCHGVGSGYYPYSGYPASFYHCHHGIHHLITCQPHYIYSTSRHCCVYHI